MIAGAKVATFSLPPNIFRSFFQKIYNFPLFLGKIGGIPILYNIWGGDFCPSEHREGGIRTQIQNSEFKIRDMVEGVHARRLIPSP